MKQALLSVYQSNSPEAPPPDALERIMQNDNALREAMKAVDGWLFSGGLHPPSTATVMRAREGAARNTDRLYFEGQEHIGGFTIIRAATLPIEVRPFR